MNEQHALHSFVPPVKTKGGWINIIVQFIRYAWGVFADNSRFLFRLFCFWRKDENKTAGYNNWISLNKPLDCTINYWKRNFWTNDVM